MSDKILEAMKRWGKWVLIALVVIVAINLLLILTSELTHAFGSPRGTAQAISGGTGLSRHWCHHHPRKCKRALRHSHYGKLHVDRVPLRSMGRAKRSDPCKHFQLSGHYGGRRVGDSGYIGFVSWVSHLNVQWCWNGSKITYHYQHGWVDQIAWTSQHNGDTHIDEWYPWGHRTAPHIGRFQGLDSTMHRCALYSGIGFSCFLERDPFIHMHEHADGSYTYTSSYNESERGN